MNDIFLRLVPLDGPDEVIMPDPDGNWNIYINAKLSEDARLRAYEHALRHIEGNDWERLSVQEIEAAAHAER